jgi:hypothetical protein
MSSSLCPPESIAPKALAIAAYRRKYGVLGCINKSQDIVIVPVQLLMSGQRAGPYGLWRQ